MVVLLQWRAEQLAVPRVTDQAPQQACGADPGADATVRPDSRRARPRESHHRQCNLHSPL